MFPSAQQTVDDMTALPVSSAAASRRLAYLLRLGAVIEILAFPWVLLPAP